MAWMMMIFFILMGVGSHGMTVTRQHNLRQRYLIGSVGQPPAPRPAVCSYQAKGVAE